MILAVIPFQKAVKQSLWSCMVKMKDSEVKKEVKRMQN